MCIYIILYNNVMTQYNILNIYLYIRLPIHIYTSSRNILPHTNQNSKHYLFALLLLLGGPQTSKLQDFGQSNI